MEKDQAAKQYHRIKNRLFLVSIILNILALLFLFLSGLSAYLKTQIQGFNQQSLVVNALYALGFSLFMTLTGLPLSFYEGFVLEHRFNLSNQNLLNWCKDGLKNFVLSTAVILIAVEALYIFLRKFPHNWWLWATGFWLFLTVIIARITPALIIPLFFKYHKVDNPDLKAKIFSLLDKCRVKIRNIFYIDFSKKTKKANAFICGFADNRRLILTDTLLKNFDQDEISAVVAHELGHYKNHDIGRIILVNTIVSFFSFLVISRILQKTMRYFGIARIDDITFFPVLVLGIFLIGLVMLPLLNAFSRRLEKRADEFALQITGDARGFISMMNKLGTVNLADFSPSRMIEIFMYDHPPIARRIKMAEEFGKAVNSA